MMDDSVAVFFFSGKEKKRRASIYAGELRGGGTRVVGWMDGSM